MTAISRTRRGLLAFVLVFAMLASLRGGLPAAAMPETPLDAISLAAPYAQNFDMLATSGTTNPWADDTTIGGWYSTRTVYIGSNGSLTNGGLYSFGATGASERALGSIASGSTDTIRYGARFTNDTGSTITAISVAYTGEQWRNGGNTTQHTLTFDYQVGASVTSLTTGTWTSVAALDFTGPIATSTAGALDGNDSANRVAISHTFAVSIAPGHEVMLRWGDPNDVGNDHGLAIDDLTVTASTAVVDDPPTVTSTTPTDGATDVPVDALVSVTFSEPVTVTGTIAIDCTSSGVQDVTPADGPTTFNLPHADFDLGETCTVTILATQVTDQDGDPDNMADDYTWSFDVTDGCFGPSTPISAIQGNGLVSPLVGEAHTVEGVVIADFQQPITNGIRGFFIQTPDGEDDSDPTTSEGLFIFTANSPSAASFGDYVRVSGTVGEFQDQTQLGTLTAVTICDTDPLTVTPTPMTLPFPSLDYRERFEGMSIVMTQTLTVSENFNLGRGGILTLSNGRLQQPTNVVLPGAPANTLQAANDLNQITLDDLTRVQNPDPIIYPPPELTALNTLRSGDEVSEVVGVITQGTAGWSTGNLYRIYPSAMPTFAAANPRPVAPNPVRAGGSLKVSAFNVLNYFLTIDDGSNNCGPNQNVNCRGADSALEFTRQRDKLLQALYTLNADVVGLMELENTPNVEPLEDIVVGLNALAGAGTYDYIDAGTIVPGDVIKVGIIYKPGVVQPVGNFAILNSTVDPTFDTSLHRPALAQTFQEVATNGRFTVIVNHLKSKGCTGATGLNADQGDGQSCWNLARTEAANALVNWALSDPTGMGDPDFLIMGDLNSYAKEDPIAALETAGYTNLETLFEGDDAYSYVFFAQAGSLDHSMANASLTPQVMGATTWHINADEPSVLDYNVEFKNANQQTILYNADPYRTSDHDPVLIGLNLIPAEAGIVITKTVGMDAGVCATTNDITVAAGTAVYYCYEVANTGNLTLNLHDLADSELGPIFSGFNYALTPGSSVDTVAAGLTISATIDATTVNTALWTAYNVGPIDVVTATATATVTVLIQPPNIFVDPLSISSSQDPDVQTQHTLTISNTGGSPLNWQIFDQPTVIAGPASPLPLLPFEAVLADEMEGIERRAPAAIETPDPAARALAKRALLTTGLLLVPDSTSDRIMALDPITGNVIDPNFVPNTPAVGTGINAILSAGGDSILLSDQTGDVVHEFDLDGNYLGIFAPAGGVNTAILDNMRGISLRPNGNLLVTVAGGANTNAVAEFDTGGNYLGNFIANAAGGLGSPWDPFGRSSDWLVSGSAGTTGLLRYDLAGAFLNVFAPISTFPEQIAEAGNGNVLVANFSPSSNQGVLEYTAAGVFVGRYAPTELGGYRGVYELPGGTILTTTGAGVHEIDRSGNLVESKITGISGRFIEYVAPPITCSTPAEIPWASVIPSSGTIAAGNATTLTVTLDSTGLAPGVYTGNLCIESDDPDAGPGNETDLVIVPLELTVEIPTAVTLSSIGASQMPLPAAGLPLAALPAVISLALGAAYALRRRQ